MSLIDAVSSEQTSERVMRGLESNALNGLPHAQPPYGYRRIYDPITRGFVRQEPDTWDGDGRAVEDSPAYVVREIFDRIAAGDSLNSIRRDLDRRGIPTPGSSSRWLHGTIRAIGLQPAYIGQRVHQGEVLEGVQAVWPPLVDEDTFWKVQRILTDSSRNTSRPSRARCLLSHIARCAQCGSLLRAGRPKGRPARYECLNQACIGIVMAHLDEYVERRIVAWLSDPEVFTAINNVDDSAAAAQARADGDRARVELEEWRQLADRGEVSAAGYARAEKGLLGRIAEADQRAYETSGHPVLHDRIGPTAEAAWESATLEVKRQIIRTVADIRVRPVGCGQTVLTRDRVEWRWLLGPDQEPHVPPGSRSATPAARRGCSPQ